MLPLLLPPVPLLLLLLLPVLPLLLLPRMLRILHPAPSPAPSPCPDLRTAENHLSLQQARSRVTTGKSVL